MGQKIHPIGFRLGNVYTWKSRWYVDDTRYHEVMLEDVRLRRMLQEKLKNAGLSHVEIERSIHKIRIVLYVSRPGVVIGRGGSGLETIKKYIEAFLRIPASPSPYKVPKKSQTESVTVKVDIAVEPVKEPNLNAHLVATMIADQLVKRLPHRRVCNQSVERVMNAGAKGVRIILAGRIAGAEIARREKFQAGTVPLSTIREAVDFDAVPALTKSGYIGIKVWICRKSS